MAFESGTAYPESDADDEYERSVHDSSPVLATDDEASQSESEGLSSSEHTPTTYGKMSSGDQLPDAIITEWTPDECADFVGSLGLQQYADQFLENEIVGEALVALQHEDLKEMGIPSVGHRLTILKSVYDIKVKQDIPIESDHYVPLSADAEAQYATATLKDIRLLIEQLRLRDERMTMAELELRRITEEYRRLREDLLPVFRMAKEGQPLPHNPPVANGQSYNQQTSYGNVDASTIISPPSQQSSLGQSSNGIKRQYSTKQLAINSTPKNASPTHSAQNGQDRLLMEQALDPSGASERAVISSSHLAAMNGGSQTLSSPAQSPNIPSPTSPPTNSSFSGSTLVSHTYRPDTGTLSGRSTYSQGNSYASYSSRDSSKTQPLRAPTPAIDQSAANSSSVEIFKSFRVSMEDPCWKVLPAALKKYNINAPWENYALFIVFGDEERCLELHEKPLILFKQLDKEGKKPMFMLRKTNAHPDAVGAEIPGSAGLDGGLQFQRGPSGRTQGIAYNPPGGII